MIFSLYTLKEIRAIDKRLERDARDHARKEVTRGKIQVSQLLNDLCDAVDQIAITGADVSTSESQLKNGLQELIHSEVNLNDKGQRFTLDFYQLGLAYLPNRHSASNGLFSPWMYKAEGSMCYANNQGANQVYYSKPLDSCESLRADKSDALISCSASGDQRLVIELITQGGAVFWELNFSIIAGLSQGANCGFIQEQFTRAINQSRQNMNVAVKDKARVKSDQALYVLSEQEAKQGLNDFLEATKSLIRVQSAVSYGCGDYREKTNLSKPLLPAYFRQQNGFCYATGINPLEPKYYDYTQEQEQNAWFHDPLYQGPGWAKSYIGLNAKTRLLEYSVPLVSESKEHEISGVAFANMSVAQIRDVLFDLRLGVRGYGVLSSLAEQDERTAHYIVAHPKTDLITKDIFQSQDTLLQNIIRQYQEKKVKEDGMVEFNPLWDDQKLLWVNVSKIDTPSCRRNLHKYSIGEDTRQRIQDYLFTVILDPSDFALDNWQARRDWIQVLLASLVAVSCFFAFVFRVSRSCIASMYAYVSFFSVLCLSSLVVLWIILLNFDTPDVTRDEGDIDKRNSSLSQRLASSPDKGIEDFIRVYNEESALALLSSFELPYKNFYLDKSLYPVRVFLQSLDFNSANNVSLTGYIWLTINKPIDQGSIEGFRPVFPEAESVEFGAGQIVSQLDNASLVRWYFTTTLRQPFSYRRYPFDIEDVWLRIWSHDLNATAILVPEFSAYKSIKPSDLPGIEEKIVLDGWDAAESFFSYRKSKYNITFGQEEHASGHYPELYFNLRLERNFFDPFISDMLPIFVVCLLVFAVLLISTTDPSKNIELKGFSSANVLSYCAALYFVLIVSHVHLRDTLNAHGIIYLEIFYFCMYITILVVSANSLLLTCGETPWFLRFLCGKADDNLFVRLSFFPVITLFLLVATVWMFY